MCPLLVAQRASDSSKCVRTGGWGWSEEMVLFNLSVPGSSVFPVSVRNSAFHFVWFIFSFLPLLGPAPLWLMSLSACFPRSFSRPSLGCLHCSNGCPLRPAFGCVFPPLPHPHLSLEVAYQSLHCHSHKGPSRNSCPCHSVPHGDQETVRGHEPSLLLRL